MKRPPTTGWFQTAAIFGAAAVLLLVVTRFVIPVVSRALSIETIVSWFISAGLLAFAVLACFGWWLLHRERLALSDLSLAGRLWIRPFSRTDWIWCAGALAVIGVASLLIQYLLRTVTGEADLSPSFMTMEALGPGRYWILVAWLPFWVLNILGEEFLWRGVLLPRQEAALGQLAWTANAAGWLLFHIAFGPQLVLSLLPIIVVLPHVVQRRRNTLIGVVIHAALNGPGFVAVALGVV